MFKPNKEAEMTNQASTRTMDDKPRERNAERLVGIFMAAGLLAALTALYLAVTTGLWQAFALSGAFIGFFVLLAMSGRYARSGRLAWAGYMLAAGVVYIVLAVTILMGGIGLPLAIALALVVAEIVSETLPGRQGRSTLAAGIIASVAIILLDRFAAWERPVLATLQVIFPSIAAIVVLSVGLLTIERNSGWRDLTLSRKLYFSFGSLALLAIVVGSVALIGLNRVTTSFETALLEGDEMESESLHVRGDLATTRQLEGQFLLRWKEIGFEPAYELYYIPLTEALAETREHLGELSQYKPAIQENLQDVYSVAQFEADLALMHADVDEYERGIQLVLLLIQERGFQDTGLEGEFRDAAHRIEEQIGGHTGLDPLIVALLQTRRHEKDYLLRGDPEYVDATRQGIAGLKQEIRASNELAPGEKAELQVLADEYLAAFEALVAKDAELAALTVELQRLEQEMAPLTERLAELGQTLSERERMTAQTAGGQTLLYSTVLLFAALLVSGFLSVTLAQQLTRPVVQLIKAAHELEAGNYDAQTDVTSKDELGNLASTFNLMAHRLKEAITQVTKRAVELQSVAEIATKASATSNIQQMLQTVVDMTKASYNLYHAHIYLLDDSRTNLLLSAGAGEPGRLMVDEKRSIPLDHPHSLVARAARSGLGAIANDVTQEPDFLPNPLLPDTKAEMAIPIAVGDSVLGVLDVQADYVNRFTDEDVAIKTTLAQQVAVSLQNARTFSQAQSQAQREAMLNLINQKIQSATSVEAVLQIAARELGRALGAPYTVAQLGAVSKPNGGGSDHGHVNGN